VSNAERELGGQHDGRVSTQKEQASGRGRRENQDSERSGEKRRQPSAHGRVFRDALSE
jgi:hypothetical protein